MAVCFRERAISTRKLFRPLSWESWSLPVPVGKPQWGLPGEPWGSEPVCCGPAPSWVPRPMRCAEQTQGMCLQVLYTLLQSECSFGKIKKRILFLYILEITLIDYLKFDTFPKFFTRVHGCDSGICESGWESYTFMFIIWWGKRRLTVVSTGNTELFLVLLFINFCIIFYMNNCTPTFAPPRITEICHFY